MKKVISFMIVLIMLLSCDKENKHIPFKNIPHTHYFDLKGNVFDIQISFSKEIINEQGYYNPVSTNLKDTPFMGEFNPVYKMLFYGIISDYREDVDIFYPPIKAIQMVDASSPYIHNITYTFNKEGYIENFSLLMDNKQFAYVNIQYNKNLLVGKVEKLQPTIDPFHNITQKKTYDNSLLESTEYSYFDKDSVFEVEKKSIFGNNPNIQINNYHYKLKEKNIIELTHSTRKGKLVDSSYIYLDKKKLPLKIINKNGTALVKNNMVYSFVYNNSNFAWTNMKAEFDQERKLIKDQYLWEIVYDSTNNRIKELKSLMIYDLKGEPLICKAEYTDDEKGNWITMKIIPDRSLFDELEREKKRLISEMNKTQNEITHYNNEWNAYLYELTDKYQSLKKQYQKIINGYYGEYISDTKVREMSSIFIVTRNISYY